jgi:dihydrofolate synthase / folylpolyglutamate synthase
MNYLQSVDYLYGLGHEVLTAKYRLENIEILLERLGNPQNSFRSILVAGTNGKGSVAAMIESIARQTGHRTALYTSPHLIRIEERLRVCGVSIVPDDFAKFASLIRAASEQLVEENRLANVPTFFEQVTAIALAYFCEARVELAVLEVGLGGRLDATNAVARIMSVITSIDFDHQEILGNSIEEIATEKAAIIQHEARAVIGRQVYPQALEVLQHRCTEVGVAPVFANQPMEVRYTDFGRAVFRYRSQQGNHYDVKLGLRGRHQTDNAALAIEACETISQAGLVISREAISKGLAEVVWQGRLEFIEGKPAYLFDGAHNQAGAKVLKDFLQENWQASLTLIFAAMSDKDIEGMSAELFPIPDKIILTSVDEKRGASEKRLKASQAVASGELLYIADVEKALTEALAITPTNGLICIAGSLYLVGAIKKLLQDKTEHYGTRTNQ